ncbi:MAG: hypothetical protein JW955_08175 [Sedimentisphaerales bacterium]|nr:hypothetical protein [Sedimentisphaerales bacterium]
MRRAWFALALLSASWLFGLSYYHQANWIAWAVLVTVGTLLLTGVDIPRPVRGELLITAALLVPAIWLAPWPYRGAVVLIFSGATLCTLPIPRRWPAQLGTAGIAAGVILLVQSAGMLLYESITARSHELPHVLAYPLYGVTRLLGIDAALDGTTIAIYSMRRVHQLGATWELLLDPATWCFLLGGVALLPAVSPRRGRTKPIIGLAIAVFLWLPVRGGLLIALLTHRTLRTEYEAPLTLMNQFWSPWVHLILLLVPVLLALRFVRLRPALQPDLIIVPRVRLSQRLACTAITGVAVLLACLALFWDPAGPRKQGRVLVDEHHSTWERTDRPYDTNWYGQESGYNYACIYDYLSRFYTMGRLDTPIDANALENCDILIAKVPTARYGPAEIDHIEQFVRNGGGLLLVGEHTNVFQTGVHLNDIARRFGFRFRYDCLFDIDGVFRQIYKPGVAPHPMIQNMPPLDFAVSCSIDPGLSIGRAAILATGLRNLPADYHASNFYPQVEDRAEARCGAFIELWTLRRGAGRVAAFGDSTIFSNFSTFEPGKAELMLGMLEWLNHRNAPVDPHAPLVALSILLAGTAFALGRRWPGSRLMLLAGVLLGWPLAIVSVRAIHHATYPLPRPARPFAHVAIDRTVCDAPLSRSGFIAGEPNGFGIFERWILRLGCFTSRRQGNEVFDANAVVFMHPNQPVSPEFRTALSEYVSGGGRVLILDSPANTQSTANLLLHPFGLSVDHATNLKGTLAEPEGWPAVTVDSACEVKGGVPLIKLDAASVASTIHHGQGTVTVIGFASRFSDRQMGVTGDVIPDAQLRQVFELEFSLLRSVLPNSQ